MTGSPLKMACDDIRKKLKDFISDLLAESDYQAFVEHLDDCPKCTSYVRGMGSFSNQLWELGDIEVPSDLDSTILFQFKKAKNAPRPKKGFSKKLVFGVVVLVAGLFIAFGGMKLFKGSEPSPEGDVTESTDSDDAVIIEAPVIKKKKVSDAEAERLFTQLQGMAKSLEPLEGTKEEKKTSEEEASEEKDAPVSEEQSETDDVLVPDSYSLHWHVPYLGETKMKQLLNTIKSLGILVDYEDQDFLIFTTEGGKLKLLSEGIRFTNQVDLDLPEFILKGYDLSRKIPTSIYFEGRRPSKIDDSDPYADPRSGALRSVEKMPSSGSNIFDWHALLVSSQQDALLSVMRKGGGTINYTSKEAIVFSIPGVGLQSLVDELQSMGGIFIDFGDMGLEESSSLSGAANVMIYFSKR